MDAPCGDPHPRADLEQPQAQRCRAGPGKRRFGKRLTKAVVENVGEGRKVKPDGVGIEQVGRAALGEQAALQFLHTIFRIAPGTVEDLVKAGWLCAPRDVTMYRSFSLLRQSPSRLRPWIREEPRQPPAGAEPTFLRPAGELAAPAARLAGLPGLGRGLGHRAAAEILEPAVLRQTRHIVDILLILAPRHDVVAAKAGIDAHDDARLGPVGEDPSSSS